MRIKPLHFAPRQGVRLPNAVGTGYAGTGREGGGGVEGWGNKGSSSEAMRQRGCRRGKRIGSTGTRVTAGALSKVRGQQGCSGRAQSKTHRTTLCSSSAAMRSWTDTRALEGAVLMTRRRFCSSSWVTSRLVGSAMLPVTRRHRACAGGRGGAGARGPRTQGVVRIQR